MFWFSPAVLVIVHLGRSGTEPHHAPQLLLPMGRAVPHLSNVCEHGVRDTLTQRGHQLQDQKLPPLPGVVLLQLQQTPSSCSTGAHLCLVFCSHLCQRLQERKHREALVGHSKTSSRVTMNHAIDAAGATSFPTG